MLKILSKEDYFKYHTADASMGGTKNLLKEMITNDVIKNITYIKAYDKSCFILTTLEQWFYDWLFNFNEFDHTLFFKKIRETLSVNEHTYCIWSHLIKDKLLDFNHQYSVNAGFDIYKRRDSYVEMLSVSGENIDELHNFCINNLEYLHKMFNEASNATKNIKQQVVEFPLKLKFEPLNNNLIINNKSVHLTEKEMDCIKQMMKGYTMKATAKELNISPRTVETHLYKIKQKLQCNNKFELLRLMENNPHLTTYNYKTPN